MVLKTRFLLVETSVSGASVDVGLAGLCAGEGAYGDNGRFARKINRINYVRKENGWTT